MKQQANLEIMNQAIDQMGGLTKFSLDLKISYQTALNWKHGRRAPSPLHCAKIERATEGKIKAKDILPDYPWDDFSQLS